MKGHYTFNITNTAGEIIKRYGPWTLQETRDNLHVALKQPQKEVDFAIEIATNNPGVAYVLSGQMTVKDPLGIEPGQVAISWTAELTYWQKEGPP